MKEEFVSYEIARKLKECGFDWYCDHYYELQKEFREARVFPATFRMSDFWHNFNEDDQPNRHNQPFYPEYSAPSLSLAQKWLRDVKGIAINVIAHDGGKWEYDIVFLPNAVETDGDLDRSPWCRTYEEALEEGIDTALTFLTEKQ